MLKSEKARVVVFCSSLRNPFIEAWASLWEATGADVVVLANIAPNDCSDTPSDLASKTIYMQDNDGAYIDNWDERVIERLGGEPSAIFYWWGLGSLSDTRPANIWKAARVILCVDTYPNASRLLTEVRELFRAAPILQRVDSFVVTSEEMARLLRKRLPMLRSKQMVTVASPFSLRAHASTSPEPARSSGYTLGFTGRSDYLFSTTRSMAKDALGPWLQSLIGAGMTVAIQDPGNAASRTRLVDAGFVFYPRLERKDISTGKFADVVSGFDAHLVYYNTANATLHRRVSTGLSTRFATGLCSPTPMVVPPTASFALEFFKRNPIGFAAATAEEISNRLDSQSGAYRSFWRTNHQAWSGENYAQAVGALA